MGTKGLEETFDNGNSQRNLIEFKQMRSIANTAATILTATYLAVVSVNVLNKNSIAYSVVEGAATVSCLAYFNRDLKRRQRELYQEN